MNTGLTGLLIHDHVTDLPLGLSYPHLSPEDDENTQFTGLVKISPGPTKC